MKRIACTLLLSSILCSTIASTGPKLLVSDVKIDHLYWAIANTQANELEQLLISRPKPLTLAQKRDYVAQAETVTRQCKAATLKQFSLKDGLRAAYGLITGTAILGTLSAINFPQEKGEILLVLTAFAALGTNTVSQIYKALTHYDAKQKFYKALHVENLIKNASTQD